MDSKNNFENIDKLTRIKVVCSRIYKNPKDINSVRELQFLVNNSSPTVVTTLEPIIFSVFFPILTAISESNTSYKTGEKQQIVDTFKSLFDKIAIDKLPLFFNIYGFLLYEIYDHKNHKVMDISEEYKLSIVECMISLAKCLDSSVVESLYVKENAPKLCQMIYVLLDLAKMEQFKTLRISAINCIMALARVLDDNDFSDLVTRNQVAEVFLFFLPGVASQLKSVALIDEKFGHKIPSVALEAWGRIVTLLMQDYRAFDEKLSDTKPNKLNKHKWKDDNELKEYIQQAQRSPEWYKDTDRKLQQLLVEFSKLTHHSHPKVRLELANMSALLVDNCIQTMPTSISHLIDIVIILSEDSDSTVASKSKIIMEGLSQKLTSNELKSLLDNLEEGFYNVIASIPRKFNGIDERVVALNSLVGYISLFGTHSLTNVLYSTVHLNKLVLTLIHISEFDKSSISLLEEYTTVDYEMHQDFRMAWKKFRHFKEDSVLHKIESVCHVLAKFGASCIISDLLLDIIVSDSNQRKEAIFLLNEIVAGLETRDRNLTTLRNIIATYTDINNWYLPLSVGVDEDGYEYTLSDIQDNIIQVCLLVEGIGKIALTINKEFEQFMLKTLYLVLERAGSSHPLIRSAGLSALSNITTACGYSNITHLINKNIDYFSFHIERKLKKASGRGGLNVLAVVMSYSSMDVLHPTCEVIKELLMRTYDKQRSNLNDYLYVFRMFIQCLHRWLSIKADEEPFKTKQQKQQEIEDFKVSNIDEDLGEEDFSDDIMGKTAEEMYEEDLKKSKMEDDELQEEYKKPEPPVHIKLTVAILTQSLHCLPSKNQSRKLLVLEILKDGLPVLKEWEDELLPIVHQIWSPLVARFKETSDPLIINYSFQLLAVLARLSKDFIRSRTSKEVLPEILTVLDKLAQESYLKDKGSAYRYSQNYKLQQTILAKLPYVVTDLDMLQGDLDKIMAVVFKYLSDKQPVPLQVILSVHFQYTKLDVMSLRVALEFFVILEKYDRGAAAEKIGSLSSDSAGNEFEKNIEEFRNS
ncbi:TELO2-interacting protein 1 -like, partial [Asbolus verrucosus]